MAQQSLGSLLRKHIEAENRFTVVRPNRRVVTQTPRLETWQDVVEFLVQQASAAQDSDAECTVRKGQRATVSRFEGLEFELPVDAVVRMSRRSAATALGLSHGLRTVQ